VLRGARTHSTGWVGGPSEVIDTSFEDELVEAAKGERRASVTMIPMRGGGETVRRVWEAGRVKQKAASEDIRTMEWKVQGV